MIATASAASSELVRSLGADDVFDYSDPNVSFNIREATRNSLAHAVDCISEGSAQESVAACFGPRGGTVATTIKYANSGSRPEVVDKVTLVFTLLGKVCTSVRGLCSLSVLPAYYRAYMEPARDAISLRQCSQVHKVDHRTRAWQSDSLPEPAYIPRWPR